MPAAPRHVEALLQSLGADREFTDDVLGDLAEEFYVRCRWDGVTAARRWYYGQALRTAPHLLRDWGRRLQMRDTAPLAWGFLAGLVTKAVLGFLAARVTFWVTGIPLDSY